MAGNVYLAIWLRTSRPRPWSAATRPRRTALSGSHLQIIWLLSQGHSARAVASVTGYSPTWISKIVWRYNDHGVAGLGDRRHNNPGAAALLDETQQERSRSALDELPPDRGRWTGRWDRAQGCPVDERPTRPPGVATARRRVSAPARLDAAVAAAVPCRRRLDRAAQVYKKRPARIVELTRTQIVIPLELWSCDEHRVGLKPILRRIGAPRGCRPIAPGHHRYQWLSLYGFVRPASGEVVWFIANAIDAAMFSALLKAFAQEIRAGPDKQVILVLDGAGSHVAKDLEVPDGIELMFLPP